jgi:hypothetical protein
VTLEQPVARYERLRRTSQVESVDSKRGSTGEFSLITVARKVTAGRGILATQLERFAVRPPDPAQIGGQIQA